MENIEKLFKEETDVLIETNHKEVTKKISFENLTFQMFVFVTRQAPYVLKGITFEVNKGDQVAIVVRQDQANQPFFASYQNLHQLRRLY